MASFGHCEDCGTTLERTGCPNCNEEDFIDVEFAREIREIHEQGLDLEPELCPMGCGRTTEDPYGGPCERCWELAPKNRP